MTTLVINDSRTETGTFRVLQLHAGYACENSGGCCRHGWRIPLNKRRLAELRSALKKEGMAAGEIAAALPDDAAPTALSAGSIGCDSAGGCVFVGGERENSRCTLQERLGHAALPEICQSFPRMIVRTPAGVYMTLSYTCPTAARLLLKEDGLRETAPAAVYKHRPALAGVARYDEHRAPQWGAGVHPEWAAFDYFWRWSVDFAARPGLNAGEALYALGVVVGAIEQHAEETARMAGLGELLESVAANPAEAFAGMCRGVAPSTELGLIGIEALLRENESAAASDAVWAPLWNTERRSLRDRAELAERYDRLVRPALKGIENVERNYVVSRLYANPLAYRSGSLRAGYYANVLGLTAFRMALLGLSFAGEIDEGAALKGAAAADRLMLHSASIQTRFVKRIDAMKGTELGNLMRPALF